MIIRTLQNIQDYLEKNLDHYKNATFYMTSSTYPWKGEHYEICFDSMILHLSYRVEQYLIDEDFDFESEMPEISKDQWDEWLKKYELDDDDYCSCANGCKTCLMTEC